MNASVSPLEIFDIDHPSEGIAAPPGTCLMAYRGSKAHGMFVPSSNPNGIDDVDIMGIVLGAPENYLGLHEWGSRGTSEIKRGKWDCVFYEIRKMFALLLQGNPNVLGLLWTRPCDYLFKTNAGIQIQQARALFVGKHVYNAFAGYAHAQLEKMETRDPAELREYVAVTNECKYRGIHPNHKGETVPYPDNHDTQRGEGMNAKAYSADSLIARLRHFQKKGENIGYLGDKRKQLVLQHGYDAKNAAHCIRLLRMCKEFLATGEMIVYRPDAAELLEIKTGKWPLEKIKAHAAELFAEIKVARDASSLPDKPDSVGAERLLVRILAEHVGMARFS